MKAVVLQSAAVAALAAITASGGHAQTITPIALSGQAAPGGTGLTFSTIGLASASLGGDGSVIFQASLSGSNVTTANDTGLFDGNGSASPIVVAREGDQTPGTPSGVLFNNFLANNNFSNTAAGQVSFVQQLPSGAGGVNTTNQFAIFGGAPSAISLVLRQGDAAPQSIATTISSIPTSGTGFNFSAPNGTTSYLASRGTLATNGTTVTSINDSVILAGSPGALVIAAREGDLVPGGDGATFAGMSTTQRVANNSSGQIAFMAPLSGTGVSGAAGNNQAIIAGSPGSLALIARAGNQVPGFVNGTLYSTFFATDKPPINSSGAVVFADKINGAGVTTNVDDTAIFSGTAGSVGVVAQQGKQAAGVAAGVNYSGVLTASNVIGFNNNGQTTFQEGLTGAGVDSSNSSGIFAGTPNNVLLIARTGDQLPGASGVFFSALNSTALNSSNDIAMLATLSGTDVTSANNSALVIGSPGNLQTLLRTGDLFDVNPDPTIADLRTISLITLSTNIPSALNDNNQLLFGLSFTDGTSGLFESATPEPASFALLGLAGLMLSRRRSNLLA